MADSNSLHRTRARRAKEEAVCQNNAGSWCAHPDTCQAGRRVPHLHLPQIQPQLATSPHTNPHTPVPQLQASPQESPQSTAGGAPLQAAAAPLAPQSAAAGRGSRRCPAQPAQSPPPPAGPPLSAGQRRGCVGGRGARSRHGTRKARQGKTRQGRQCGMEPALFSLLSLSCRHVTE